MVFVDEDGDEIERIVMVAGERFIDRETMGDMLFDPEQLERISSSRQQAAHALYVGDHERWPDPSEWGDQGQLGRAAHERRRTAAPGLP